MDFLKSILGDDLFAQVSEKITAYNGDEANKDKQVKLANLSEGGYVSKDKYTTLETDLTGSRAELEKANGLIAELKKSAGKDQALQQKISEYEQQIADLQAENQRLKVENALKFALAQAGAEDVDYLVFKTQEKLKADNKTLELGEDDKIKGIDDLIAGLKTQHPAQFTAAGNGGNGAGGKKVLENNLPGGAGGQRTVTKEQFYKMGYSERLKLKNENPELFNQLSH